MNVKYSMHNIKHSPKHAYSQKLTKIAFLSQNMQVSVHRTGNQALIPLLGFPEGPSTQRNIKPETLSNPGKPKLDLANVR